MCKYFFETKEYTYLIPSEQVSEQVEVQDENTTDTTTDIQNEVEAESIGDVNTDKN